MKNQQRYKWYKRDVPIRTLVDTGATVSLIKYDSLNEKAKKDIDRSTSAVIRGISTDEIRSVGTIRRTLYSIPIEFYVIKNKETIFTGDAFMGMTTLRYIA